MKPAPGMALAQIDYSSQEIGIAAALSRDPALMADFPLPETRECVHGALAAANSATLSEHCGVHSASARCADTFDFEPTLP